MTHPARTALRRTADVLAAPATLLASMWLRRVRQEGVQDMPVSRRIFEAVGVFPIRRHYYEPLFDARDLRAPLDEDRRLPGVDLNVAGQLAMLAEFAPRPEVATFPTRPAEPPAYYFGNDFFDSWDAEYLYHVVRHFRPRRFVEVGSGMSTLLVRRALDENRREDPAYRCRHVCVEPYENAWLGRLDVELVRRRVEDVPRALFEELEAGDVLFIDSSHVVRPQGDVVTEYLEILPLLRPGVLVHVHDIFTPRDYPAEWVRDRVWLWTEQYLVEAFLSFNSRFEVLGALSFLERHHRPALAATCPVSAADPGAPAAKSLWLRVRG